MIARGEGAVVEDVDGNRFLDCAAGIAVNSTGVSHPEVVKAITEQAQKFIHMSGTDFYYEPQVRLAEELAAIVPIAGDVRTFFANSGTEATEAAIKLAQVPHEAPRHHRLSGRVPRPLAGVVVAHRQQGHPAARVRTVHARRVSRAVSGYATGPPAPMPPRRSACRSSKSSSSRTWSRPTRSSSIVVEPIQGEGGYLVAPPAFLQGLRELTTKHGILLVVDEVQSGMGRTGRCSRRITSASRATS